MKEIDIETVLNAQRGDKKSLNGLFLSLKDDVFNIATKFFLDFHDAEDATQEILIKILESLYQLRDPHRFIPWSYRIAVNHLKSLVIKQKSIPIRFELMESDSRSHHKHPDCFIEEDERRRLTAELKISCTTAMLFCLSVDERIAFIFDVIFELKGPLASDILEIQPATYRKRLSRAHRKIDNFVQKNCSLLAEDGPCKCRSRVAYAIMQKRIFKGRRIYTSQEHLSQELNIDSFLKEMEQLDSVSGIFKHNPHYQTSDTLTDYIKDAIDSEKNKIFHPIWSQ